MSAGSVPSHGNSPAAWTAVIIMIVAFAIGTFAFWFGNAVIVIAAAVLVVIGALVGLILKAAGYGVEGDKLKPKQHS